MEEDNNIFSPETVDEQIERSPDLLAQEDARLINALYKQYQVDVQQNARSLERGWERIKQSKMDAHSQTNTPIVHMEEYKPRRERVSQVKNTSATSTKMSRLKQQLGLVAAVACVVLLVGSMAVVFNLASHKGKNTTTGDAPRTITVPVPHPITVPGIYISSEKDWSSFDVSRLDTNSHAILWSHNVGEMSSSIVVVGSAVYVSTSDQHTAYVDALNAHTGAQLWQAALGPIQIGQNYLGMLSTPTVVAGKVYVMQRTGKAYALDATNGKTLWTYDVHETALTDSSNGSSGTIYDPGSVAVSNDVLYGTMHSTFFAVNAKNGSLLWTKQIDSDQILNDPQVVDGTVYLSSYSKSQHHAGQTQTGFVYAYNAKSGQQSWKYPVSNWVLSDPTVANGTVYFGSYDTNVYALKARDGSRLWQYNTGGQIFASPLLANGVLYVQEVGNASEASSQPSSVKPALLAIKTDGTKLWSKEVNSNPQTVQNGVLYTGIWPRLLYTFNATTGNEIWHQAYGTDLIDKTGTHNGSAPQITVVP